MIPKPHAIYDKIEMQFGTDLQIPQDLLPLFEKDWSIATLAAKDSGKLKVTDTLRFLQNFNQ